MSLTTERWTAVLAKVEGLSDIHEQYTHGNDQLEIPVDGGTLFSMLNQQRRVLTMQADINDFVVETAEAMDNAIAPEAPAE